MRRAAILILAASCLGSGCHPPVDEEIPLPACEPAMPHDTASEVDETTLELVDLNGVPIQGSPEIEAGPDPLGGGSEALFVVPLRLRDTRLPTGSGGRRHSGSCVWAETDLGEQGALFADGLSSPVLFGVGSDLARLDGSVEVTVQVTQYQGTVARRASATVRPVNRIGYLSGN